MNNWEKTIIPLDDAHEILSVFGVGPSSRGYQRWRRDDGFRHVDFEDVLNESDSVLNVDWRESLQDAVDAVVEQLDELGIEAEADLEEGGDQGVLRISGKTARVKFVAEDDDDFSSVIEAINRLIAASAQYRKFHSCEGSDGWSYALLKNEDWKALEAVAGAAVKLLFAKQP